MLKPSEGGSDKPVASFHSAQMFSMTYDVSTMIQLVDKDLAMPGEDVT